MKSEKLVSIIDLRKEQDDWEDGFTAEICLPSTDRLWELLDTNISIAVWREQSSPVEKRQLVGGYNQ